MSCTPASAIQSCDTSQWIAFFNRGQSVIIWMPTVRFCVQKTQIVYALGTYNAASNARSLQEPTIQNARTFVAIFIYYSFSSKLAVRVPAGNGAKKNKPAYH